MKEIEVPFYKQDKSYTCGPTSLQMVLAYYGVHYSEEQLAEKLKTNNEIGTWRARMYEVAVRLGFYCYENEGSSLANIQYLLDLKIPPIVRFLEEGENEDHYGVVVGANSDTLLIHDPWNGPFQKYSVENFLNRWTLDMYEDSKQWLMAISPLPIPVVQEVIVSYD